MSAPGRSRKLVVVATAFAVPLVIGAAPTAGNAWFAPNSGAGQATSRNWAGYTATGGSFTSVSGSWTVPTVAPGGGISSDAAWVGIGGVTSQDLIQAGTQDVVEGGQMTRQAWIETLPGAAQPVPVTLHAGDAVNVVVAQQASSDWQLTLSDATTGQSYQTTVAYASSLSSADWIVEAPSDGRQEITLDNFGSIAFSGTTTVDNGQSQTIAVANGQAITMVDSNGQPIAVPSGPGGDGESFSVARTGQAAGGSPAPRPDDRRRPGRPTPRTPFPIGPRHGDGGDHQD
jgi:hypothetical protein